MPRTFFDLNLLANMVAKLGNIVNEHVKFDLFVNNVGQFGHTLMNIHLLRLPCMFQRHLLCTKCHIDTFNKCAGNSYDLNFSNLES